MKPRGKPSGRIWIALACTLALCACRGGSRQPPAEYADWIDAGRSGPLVLVGDFQRTSFGERLIGRVQNDAERARIVAAIAREPAAAVVILGDLVFDGSSASAWRAFDRLTAPIRNASLPVLPALGNHDYWGDPVAALRNVRERFPTLRNETWYARRAGRLGLIWLDSNRERLSSGAWTEQRRWFLDRLAAFDAEPGVAGVIIFAHHPPYTNSTVTGDETHVQQTFVPAFVAARKTLAWVAGHVHAYEHFVAANKHFVVSGGGGGPRVELLRGDTRRHADRFEGGSPRPFHYLRLETVADGVTWTVIGFDRGESETRIIDSFQIPFPPSRLADG